MLSWRTLCLCLLLALVGAAWAEVTDTEDGCQLEILKRPGKGKAANAKNKGRRRKKWFELLKIKSKGSAKQKAHAHRAKAKGRKTEPRLDTQNKFSDVPEVDELQVQKKPAKKQLHKHDGKAKPSLDMELEVSRDRRSGLTKGKRSFGFSGHEAAKEKGAKGKHGKSHGPTFAVTTRVYSAELPYLKHFLSYYLHDLKVERVYLFCTKKSEESQIRAAVRGFGFSEKQVTFVRGRRNASLQRLNYHAVHEDFLLDVDCDEFLVPPKGGLRGIVKSDPDADAFHLRWTCYPSDALALDGQPKGIPCTGLKGMIRTKSLHDINGHYTFVEGTPMCGGERSCVFSKHVLPLAHIQYRGFWDSVLKDVSSPAGSQWMLKGQPKSVALRKIRSGQPAKRMQSLAFEMVCVERFGEELLSDHRLQVPRRMSYSVDRHLQTKALAKAGFDRVLKMQAGKSYKRYKDALHLSFNRLLCNPKKTCNDVKPHHVAKLLENMTASMVRAYNGRCQKPESSSHGTEFAQPGQVNNHTHKKHKKAAQKAKS